MPVKSSRSSVLKWPGREVVDQAVREWARQIARERPEVIRIGYFGSYARGDWGVGSDVDLIVIVRSSTAPFERRTVGWDTSQIPVPADLLIYTQEEWEALDRGGRFYQTLMNEAIWVYERPEP